MASPLRSNQTGRDASSVEWSRIESHWKEFMDRARRQWDRLSDAQLEDAAGNRDRLCAHVEQVYRLSKGETDKQVSDWQAGLTQAPQSQSE